MSEEHCRYFNERAAVWDQLATEETLQRLGAIVKGLKIRPGSDVLDAGAGTGILIPFLQEALAGSGNIVVLDLAEEMIKRAREKHGEEGIRYVVGDITVAPFAGSVFDEVICNSCFPHFQNKGVAVKEMFRILKPGGRAVVCHTQGRAELNSMHKALNSAVSADKLPADETMYAFFEQAGFSGIAISDYPTGYLLTARKNKQLKQDHAKQMENRTKKRGRFFVVGTGPAGPQMATLQTLEILKQVDAVVASDQHVQLFADYVGGKPVLFDPWDGFWDHKGRPIADLNAEEMFAFQAKRFNLRDERVSKIEEALREGKDVALLDSGNPCFFGPGHWYVEQFAEEDIVIIPGMGCEAAALAALGKSIIPSYDTSFVLQTAPLYQGSFEKIFQGLQKTPGFPVSMVMYMIFRDHQKLFSSLKKVYPAATPCAVVYWAGYSERQRIIRGTVADMAKKIAGEEENDAGLLFIGDFLEGKPYEAAMLLSAQRAQQKTSEKTRT